MATDLPARIRAFATHRAPDLDRIVLTQGFAKATGALELARREAQALGLWAPFLPQRWGGQGLGLSEYAAVSEVLGHHIVGHYLLNCQAPDVGNMELLAEFGTDEQKEQFLRPLAEGKVRSAFAMTEPGRPGSNPTWLDTRAEVDGSGYRIFGSKWFTTGFDGAAFVIVMAVTDPERAPHERASMLLVPLPASNLLHIRKIGVMGEEGSGWMSHSELRFDGVRVEGSHLLGARGAGFSLAQHRLGPGRIHHAMRWIGICEEALEMMVARAGARELSPGEPLVGKQAVQFAIADSRVEIHAARLMVLDAARRIENAGGRAAREEISMIKVFVAGVLDRVLDRALQVHGALGMTDDTPLAFWYRHERAARIYDGADDVHRELIARLTMKRYAGRSA